VHPHGGSVSASRAVVVTLGYRPGGFDESLKRQIAESAGLPAALRVTLWPPLLGLDDAEVEEPYERLTREFGNVDPSLVRTIDGDVPRTPLDDAQRPLLRSLLLAHCVLESKWGYFQGMSDIACVALKVAADGGGSDAKAFQLLRGLLRHSSDNWSHSDLKGVWRQHRTVRAVLQVVDPRLSKRLAAIDRTFGSAEEQPFSFLFGIVFLRLKRELVDLEETCRLWEVSWAIGPHFHLLVVAALVRSQRRAILRDVRAPAELHALFGKMHGTHHSEPLLRAASDLHARAEVRNVLLTGIVPLRSV